MSAGAIPQATMPRRVLRHASQVIVSAVLASVAIGVAMFAAADIFGSWLAVAAVASAGVVRSL